MRSVLKKEAKKEKATHGSLLSCLL